MLLPTCGLRMLIAGIVLTSSSGCAQAPPWTPPRTSDGQPDLQGVWSDTSITPLQRPEALQGRQFLTEEEGSRMKSRLEQLFNDPKNDFVAGDDLFLALLSDDNAVDNANATASALAMVPREFDNRTSLITDPADGRLPMFTEEGRQRQTRNFVANMAVPPQSSQSSTPAAARQLPAGPSDLSNMLRCISWGVPKIGGNANYTSHYQIIQSPDHVVLLSEVNHEARVIPLDGRAHLSSQVRQWNGDSRGHWEADTLVVDTTNFSPKSYFMAAADGLHVVERFTRTSADAIDYEVTIDDSSTWTKPWTALVKWRAAKENLYEFACHEGNVDVMRSILAGARAEEAASR
ncbi:MAG TPA: hypothetical protein VNP02_11655 [Gammaproteobacteria bacterium]|nr:hypothetical protein [Gammaproteobacteria bacterium]